MTWFNASYLRKKALTLDHTKVSGGSDLSNFPILASFTSTDLKVVGSGGLVQNSSGFDIIFTDSTESTKLDHEIEKYVSTTGEIEMWIRIPTLSASSDTVIYMYFDNSSISTSQENITGVWDSNYIGVWHLKEATGSNPADSTSNALTATQNNSPTQGAGKIDGSLAFNGSTQYLDLGNSSVLRPSSFPMTMSAWVNVSTTSTANPIFTNNKTGNGNHSGVWMWVSAAGKIELNYGSNTSGASTGRRTKTGTTTLSTSTWYYIVGVIRGATDMSIYINGIDDGGTYTGTGGTLAYNTGLNGNIARIGDTPSGFFFLSGSQDETHFSAIERTAGWTVTEYNNQNSPSTFITVGSTLAAPVTKSLAVRTPVATIVKKSLAVRTVVATRKALSTAVRSVIKTAKTASVPLRIAITPPTVVHSFYEKLVIADAAMAYYRLDEISGTVAHDSSGNRYDATVSGATLAQPGAIAGDSSTSMLFTAPGGLTFPSTLNYTLWPALTLEFWANIGTGWHHVAIATDKNGTSLYLDGDVASSGSNASIFIGSLIDYAGNFTVAGNLDEIAVYQKKLSPAKIKFHYNAGIGIRYKPRVLGGPVSYSIVSPVTATTVTQSVGIRAAIASSVVKSAVLRTLITTKNTLLVPLRNRIRTQATPSLGVRVPTRTQVVRSLAVRLVSATRKTLSLVLRTLVASRVTLSTRLRTVLSTLVKRSTVLRSVVRTMAARSTALRTLIRTQGAKSTVARIRVETKVTRSTPLRIVTRGVMLVTRLRALIRTLVSKSTVLRIVARTLKAASTAIRTVVRTPAARSVVLRAPIQTQITKSVPARVRVRVLTTQTLLLRILVTADGTAAAVFVRMRSVIATAITRSAQLRTRVRTSRTLSTPLRIVARGISLLEPIRVRVSSRVSRLVALRLPVRTPQAMSVSLRAPVQTRITKSTAVRIVARGVTLVGQLRARVRTLITRLAPLRTRVATRISSFAVLRTPITTRVTKSVPLRIVARGVTQAGRLRIVLRTLATRSTVLRAIVRTLRSLSTQMRVRVQTRVTDVAALRSVVQTPATRPVVIRIPARTAKNKTVSVRLPVQVRKSLTMVMRNVVRSLRSQSTRLRTPVRTRGTKSIIMRIQTSAQRVPIMTLRVVVTAPVALPDVLRPLVTPAYPIGPRGCFPVAVPLAFPLIMNGTILDNPVIVTAPLLQGGQVLYGQSFTITWVSPSSPTQTALANGATGSMTFAVHDGSPITAPVRVTRVTIGTMLIATMTVTANTPIDKRVITTQFY